jgi:hypothetical protein
LIAGIDLLTIASVIRLASAIHAQDNHLPWRKERFLDERFGDGDPPLFRLAAKPFDGGDVGDGNGKTGGRAGDFRRLILFRRWLDGYKLAPCSMPFGDSSPT